MRKTLLFLLLFTSLQYVKAQSPHLKFDHFTVKDGLPQEDCLFIKQDDQGYLWIGTLNGLVRYDGYKFKVYQLGAATRASYTPCPVISMITDEQKNLWFSTVGQGIFMYNRASDDFTQIKYPQNSARSNNTYQYLQFADAKGNLWGYGGVLGSDESQFVKFDQKDKHFFLFGDNPRKPDFLKPPADSYNPGSLIFKSPSGKHAIWLGTDAGLMSYREKDKTFHPFQVSVDTTKQKSVEFIYEAPSQHGVLWLNVYDHSSKHYRIEWIDTRNKTFKEFKHDTIAGLTAGNDTVNNVYEDSKRRLWFATMKGLMFYNHKKSTFINFLPADTDREAGSNRIYSITEAKNGVLWLISGKGLLSFDPETHHFHRYAADTDNPDALSSNDVNCLLSDHSGALWAGIYYGGLDKLNTLSTVFTSYTRNYARQGGFSGGNTQQVALATKGYVLFSDEHGVHKWKPDSDQFITIYRSDKPAPRLKAVTTGLDGIVYFSDGAGFDIYDPTLDHLVIYNNDPNDNTSLSSNNINQILQDHTGIVWIATNDKGICSYDPSTHNFTRYPYITNDGTRDGGDKLDDQRALTIYEDSKGAIWAGTSLGGLNAFDRKTGQFYSFLLDSRMHVVCITSLLDDQKGHLWVGTYLLGVFEFDIKSGKYIKHVDEGSGLLFNSVLGIAEDNKGFIWISSDRGLTRMDPRTMLFKTFPVGNILPGNGISHSLHNFVSDNGRLVLGLANGITSFDPSNLVTGNRELPVVHIESVVYRDPSEPADSTTVQTSSIQDKLELPWDQNRITINYAAIHFANPGQNRYAVLMDGYDEQWVMVGTQRSITYTNLSPGTYTFHVKAANSDGLWNNKAESFTIVIGKPWWHSFWARILYIILALCGVYAFATFRALKLVHDKRKLEHRVTFRTEEVLLQKEEMDARRSETQKALAELKATQDQLIKSARMASLGELTAGIAHQLQSPLNFVNNFAEVNQEMIEELKKEPKVAGAPGTLAIAEDIRQNEEKISHHAKRMDFIVKGMMQQSRPYTGDRKVTSINMLADEFLKLAFHTFRVKDKSFNAEMITNFDQLLPKIRVVQQDIGRTLLSLFNNAFYAVNQKRKTAGPDYNPQVAVATYLNDDHIIIKVKDNGDGIPEDIKGKIMEPFFTTKPVDEAVGLGLSLAFEAVVNAAKGTLEVNNVEGGGTEVIVALPIG